MYIPGFTNYLEASIPRYARGGEVIDDMEFSDFGVGGPMMGAETVGFDLANPMLGGPEQGGLYTGGLGGGSSRTEAERQQAILDVNPYVAPSQGVNPNPITSLRSGGQTGYYFANELGLPARYGDVGLPQAANPVTFDPNAKYAASAPGFVPVDQNASYRLVRGGENGDVVYAGAGEAGLRNVFQQANKLTLDDPKNAYWGVEVLDPATGQYKRVAENQGPNGLGIVGDIAGVALPIAAAIATGGASLGVQIAAGAAAGGLGGFLAGKDPLTSALIAGATAGLGNVTGFNEAVGGALSNAGNALKNALIPEVAKQAAAEASGDIVVTGLGSLAKGLGAGALQGAASGITGGAQPTPTQQPVTPKPSDTAVDNTIVVSATPPVSGSGSPFAAAVPIPVNAMLSGALNTAQPTPTEKTAEDIEAEKNPMVVTAPKNLLPADFVTSAAAAAAANAANGMGNAPDRAEMTDEELDTYMNSDAAAKGLSLSDIADYLRLGSTGVGLIGGLIEGGKGGSSGVMYPGGGKGTLNPLFSAKLPAPNMPGATGSFAARPQSDFAVVNGQPRDWTRYGFGPEASFFNYASQPGSAPVSAPITTPIPNEPSAPAMYAPDVDNMRFARGGSPKRNAFAVSGPGTGRSDDIPAVLSDGEYVMDAETVALLGDGSSKAGAEALDRLRVNLRKHKGQKLAKGKFSVNAKRPERYLVGGRI